jgi:hypothetical protein
VFGLLIGLLPAVLIMVALFLNGPDLFASRAELLAMRAILELPDNPTRARIVCFLYFLWNLGCGLALGSILWVKASNESKIWISAPSAAVVLAWLTIRAWRKGRGRYIRITSTSPGDPPEAIRREWVGVELPLRPGPAAPVMTGYVIDGRAAVECLAAHSSEAAAWWRQNVPRALARGHDLFFPSSCCEPVCR